MVVKVPTLNCTLAFQYCIQSLLSENRTLCQERKRVFTHNSCLDKAKIIPPGLFQNFKLETNQNEDPQAFNSTNAVVMGLMLGIFIVITFVYFTYTKLRNIRYADFRLEIISAH